MFFGQFSKMMLVLAAVAMLGLGCKKATTPAQPTADAGPPVADGGTNVPEGWKVYKGGEAEFQYPENWVVSQNSDEPGIELSVAFESLPTEFPNPIEYQVRSGDIEVWVASLQPETQVTRRENGVRHGKHAWTRIIATDTQGRSDIFYLMSINGRTYALTSGYEVAGVANENLPVLEQMVESFSAGGAQ